MLRPIYIIEVCYSKEKKLKSLYIDYNYNEYFSIVKQDKYKGTSRSPSTQRARPQYDMYVLIFVYTVLMANHVFITM